MDCTNCGAPLPPKTIRCAFCGSAQDIDLRGRVTMKKGTSERPCPRCKEANGFMVATLLDVDGAQIELDRCADCQGLFFDPGELEAILDGIETRAETVDHRQLLTLIEEETPSDDFANVAYVPCPDCRQLMHRRSFGQRAGVVVDTCKVHGMWLDGGELRRLIRWTQAGGRRHHAEREAEKKALEAQLAKTPSTVPGGLDWDSETGTRRGPFGGRGFVGLDGFDLLEILAGLLRLRP